jgi:hypothetical protein
MDLRERGHTLTIDIPRDDTARESAAERPGMGGGERRRARAANGLIMRSSAVNVFPEIPVSAYRVLTGAAIDALRLGTPHDNSLILMARETGLEPATSGVTAGRKCSYFNGFGTFRSKQLTLADYESPNRPTRFDSQPPIRSMTHTLQR